MNLAALKWRFVEKFYADHGKSATVQNELSRIFADLPPEATALNVGAGSTHLDPRVKNLDLKPGPSVDYVGSAEAIPLDDDTLDLVITQETLEHVPDPARAVREMTRVLQTGGLLYLQVPFIIGYHPAPDDYWRFTEQGIVRLAESHGLKTIRTGQSVGPASGFYRVAVEFWAIALGGRSRRRYRIAKAAASLLLHPLKRLDGLMARSPEAGRIAGGFYVVAEKVA